VQYYLFDPPRRTTIRQKPLLIGFTASSIGMTPYTLFTQTNYPQLWAADARQAEFEGGSAYVRAPRSREDNGYYWGKPQAPYLLDAIKEVLAANSDIDADRVYIGGFSMGANDLEHQPTRSPICSPPRFPPFPAYKPTSPSSTAWQYAHLAAPGYYDETRTIRDPWRLDFFRTWPSPGGIPARASSSTSPSGRHVSRSPLLQAPGPVQTYLMDAANWHVL
jgi:hypothetical protein